MVCPSVRPEPARGTVEFGVRGEGTLNLDVILPEDRCKNIKKLETWSERFVNTPVPHQLLVWELRLFSCLLGVEG